MSTEPTRITFDPHALTERQLDGLACVACGTTFLPGDRSVPAGEALGAQVFAHVRCAAPCPDCGTVTYDYLPNDNDRARLDCDRHHEFPTAAPMTPAGAQADNELRERAARRATWPGGEPDSVRDMARRGDLARRADELAALLERDVLDVGDDDTAAAVRAVVASMRAIAAACRGDDDEELGRALDDSSATLRHLDGVITDREHRAE